MNTVMCDGGLANRFNALIFALVLERRFGHAWQIAWPRNSWCGAALEELIEPPLPVLERALSSYAGEAMPALMHEDQLGFGAPRYVCHKSLASYAAWEPWLGQGVLYYASLLPEWVPAEDVNAVLATLRVAPAVHERAWAFARQARLDRGTVGVHIRKTDFGAAVDDDALFRRVQASPGPHFVCSDDPAVNERFAALPQCRVFPKSHFPRPRVEGAGWLHWNTDSEGRRFPFNVDRGSEAVVEGWIDLLLLSRTTMLPTSGSTFLAMARRLQAAGVFQQPLPHAAQPASPPSAPPHPEKKMSTTEIRVPADTAPADPPAVTRPVTHAELFELLNLIKPWQMANVAKLRLGSEGDGGYVLPASSRRSNRVLSIGIGNEVSFDDQMASLGAQVLQFDHTIPKSPSAHPNIEFRRVGWGVRDEGPFMSLASMVSLLDWTDARHPILKFDTEGAEWDCLLEADDADLARFEVLTGEFHDFQHLAERSYFDKAFAVFGKLGRTHRVVHLHANNAGGIVMLGGIPFPRLLELTWMRKDAAHFAGHSSEPIPGPLDRPNVPQLPDIHLRAF